MLQTISFSIQRAFWAAMICLATLWQKPATAKSTATEPTNAAEAAAQKAQKDAATDAAYAKWKQSLSPERQAWETVLEENLGDFYLPRHKQDKVAGRPNAWDFVEDDPKLPRILLIGDSISRSYTEGVRKQLAGRANVHRAPENCGPTANALKKLDVWLGTKRWDIIHFNFGIHDRKTPLSDYEERLTQLIKRLQATGARLIWASTTPIPSGTQYGSPQAIIELNAAASKIMKQHSIAIDDLYETALPHLATDQPAGDVHFNPAGYARLASQVASFLTSFLRKETR
jgi:GDSL-like Lipase/Acylhydrolase family